MQAGKLRHLLTIQVRTAITPDSMGSDAAGWTDLATVWGSVEPLVGNEAIAARQVMPTASHKITLRYRDSVGPRNRIVWRIYEFTANSATDVCTVSGRTFQDGDRIRVANTGGALPGGLAAESDYFVRYSTGTTFKLAPVLGGTAIDITSAGTGTHYAGERVFDIGGVLNDEERDRELVLAAAETP